MREARALLDLARCWDLPGARSRSRRAPAAIRILQWPLRPALALLARPRWRGRDRLVGASGALIVCGNHTGPLDALAYGHLLQASGIAPRFLAKQSLFRIPLLGLALRSTGQIPVDRGRSGGGDALAQARAALGRGEALMVFPEGTYTRDREGWPMRARLGAARLALETGAQLVPVGCWGSRALWPVGAAVPRPGGGRRIMMSIAEPFRAQIRPGESQREAEVRVSGELMDRIAELVGQLRGQEPPVQRHDPSADAHRPESGAAAARERRTEVEREGNAAAAHPWRLREGPWHIGRAGRAGRARRDAGSTR